MSRTGTDATSPYDRYSPEEFARLGDEIYQRDIRPRIAADSRTFVAIDVETGDYEIDGDELTAIDRLMARRPSAAVWLRRVGSRYAHRFGAGRGSASA